MEEPQTQEEKSNPTPPPDPSAGPASSPLKQIRTFQGDIATALQRQRDSLVSIQRTEAAKRGGAVIPEEPKRTSSLLFFIGGFILFGLSAGGVWFAYTEFIRKTAPPEVVAPESRFIPAESSSLINASTTSRTLLITEVASLSTQTTGADLKHIILNTTTSHFLSLLETHAPGNLVRSFKPTFMLGSLGGKRFMIFDLASFENAFAGMLEWEKDLSQDVGPLFSTSIFLKNNAPTSVFEDVVSKNKDVRVLYAPIEPGSATTTPVLLYTFFDNKMLIITEDLETLHTILERLTRELLLR